MLFIGDTRSLRGQGRGPQLVHLVQLDVLHILQAAVEQRRLLLVFLLLGGRRNNNTPDR